MRSQAFGVMIGLLLLAACTDATGPADDLLANRGKWLRQYTADYTYEYQRWCFCRLGPQPVRLTVHDDSIVAAVVVATGEILTPADIARDGIRTVDQLFSIILDAIAQGADELDVDYDPLLGFPRLIAIDSDAQAADDEVTYRTANVIILQPR